MKCYLFNYSILIFISLLSLNLATLLPFSDDNECEKISSLLINHIITHNPLPEQYTDAYKLLKFSGTGLNDFGDYYACNNLPYAHFYTISLSLGQLSQSIGICYLQKCDKAYIENALLHLYDYISTKVQIPIKREDLVVSDPLEELQQTKSKYLFGLVIILSILLIGVILTILGSMTKIKVFFPFNILKNSAAIFTVRNPNKTYEYLRVFDGIRFLSCGWVVFGHVATSPMANGRNLTDITYLATAWYAPFITSAFYAVDVFFFMSGFLFYFSFQKFFNKSFSRLKLFFFSLLARYVRLLPFILFGIFGMTFILPFLSNGPTSSKVEGSNIGCLNIWWHNLLYINNMIDYTKETPEYSSCMLHGWYLACDMQFFVYSLIIAVCFNNHKLIQHIIYILTFLYSIEWQYVQVYYYNYPFNDMIHQQGRGDFFNHFYIHPIARIGPYLLGIFFCELFLHTDLYISDYEKKNKTDIKSIKPIRIEESKPKEESLDINRISVSRESNTTQSNIIEFTNNTNEKVVVGNNEDINIILPRMQSPLYKLNHYIQNSAWASWAIFLFALLCINGSFWVSNISNKHELSVIWSASLSTWCKNVFILGLGLVIHLTFLERFGFIRHFLTMKIGSVLSKSTYGIYVIHIYLASLYVLAYNNAYYLRIYDLFLLSLGNFLVSWVAALVIGLLIESPVIVICKIFIKGDDVILNANKKEKKGEATKEEGKSR